MTKQPPEVGTSPEARALWRSIVDHYELDQHEVELLAQTVRTVDIIATLQATIDELGPLLDSPQGVRTNPCIAEIRQQRLVLARLLAALRLPTGDEAGMNRPQRRGGVRAPQRLTVAK